MEQCQPKVLEQRLALEVTSQFDDAKGMYRRVIHRKDYLKLGRTRGSLSKYAPSPLKAVFLA